ncbi:MAG: SRPBCC domain-containing protein [Proteobacteria bacterium]|nr:SRPBCC domain-containing protein [Pseudomonadota bacterium]
MSKTITQTVTFKGATAKALYNLYMNAKAHAEATGAAAEITKKVGEKFNAHNKTIRGKNLLVSANKMVVQTWRSRTFERQDPDSILTLRFVDTDDGAQVEMVHALIPDEAHPHIKKGWSDHYWKKWRSYLKNK